MAKLLNIGAPFFGMKGGAKQRAAFQWRVLQQQYTVEHLLVSDSEPLEAEILSHAAIGPTTGFNAQSGRFLSPKYVCEFDRDTLRRFDRLLRENNYDVVFFRYNSAARLAQHVKKALPNAKIVIDADMLNFRIAEQAWNLDRSFKNRYFFFSFKLKWFERWLFNQPYLFFLSNSEELSWVLNNDSWKGPHTQFALIPNVMPDVPEEVAQQGLTMDASYILFHGVHSSHVNTDAFRYLCTEIYPLIHPMLKQHGVRIRIAGKGLSDFHRNLVAQQGCPLIDLVGEVDDIGKEITGALLCLIPLRIGSGTKTRVLEAAAYGKCVLTTPIGAEGLDFRDNELIVRDSTEGIASALAQLFDHRPRIIELAANLRERCLQLYSEEAVGHEMLNAIARYKP